MNPAPVSGRRVALLRGINVGKAKRVAMADLRRLFEDLGYGDVRTLLNSGNVVFTLPRGAPGRVAPLQDSLEKAVADRLGVSSRIIVLDSTEVADAVTGNPLASVAKDPARLLFVALRGPAAVNSVKPLLNEKWTPESVALRKRIAYLWCANGLAESRLWTAVTRAVGDGGTARNLTTMTKLLGLLQDT